MEAPMRMLPGNPPRLRQTPRRTPQQTPAIPDATADQELKLDDLPPEILTIIFNKMIRQYWEDDEQAVFSLDAVLDVLFCTDNGHPHPAVYNPLEPARASRALFTAALREVKLVTFVKIPPQLLRANITLRDMMTEVKLLKTMVNLQMTITVGGREGSPFDAKKNEKCMTDAIKSLHHLRDTTPHLLHLYIHISTAASYSTFEPNLGIWPYVYGMGSRAHDDRIAIGASLSRIIETVRELKIKTVDMSFDPRECDQVLCESGDESFETIGRSMVQRWKERPLVWRVQGGKKPDTTQ